MRHGTFCLHVRMRMLPFCYRKSKDLPLFMYSQLNSPQHQKQEQVEHHRTEAVGPTVSERKPRPSLHHPLNL